MTGVVTRTVERDAELTDAGVEGGAQSDAPALTKCNGCLALKRGASAHPCPGAKEQLGVLNGCLCEQCPMCSIFCPTVQGPVTDECRDCALDPPPCRELGAACNADTRHYDE